MIDNIYKNAFKEVYDILQYTEKELIEKIPTSFMTFLKNNMNVEYSTKIKTDMDLDRQNLLKETEGILALIYRSYWATDEEKLEFIEKDRNEIREIERSKKENFKGKNLEDIFKKRRNIDNIILDNKLMVIEKENFISRLFNRIIKFIKNK